MNELCLPSPVTSWDCTKWYTSDVSMTSYKTKEEEEEEEEEEEPDNFKITTYGPE